MRPTRLGYRRAKDRQRGHQPAGQPETGILLITHYQRILEYVKPHFVHVFVDGRIVKEGGPELAKDSS